MVIVVMILVTAGVRCRTVRWHSAAREVERHPASAAELAIGRVGSPA
jgi:hypothetical protein